MSSAHDPAAGQQPVAPAAPSGQPSVPGAAAGQPSVPEAPAEPPAAREAPAEQSALSGDPVTVTRLTDEGRRLGAATLRPVSPKLIPARYVAGIPGYVLGVLAVLASIVVPIIAGWWWPILVGPLPLILVVQGLALTPRRVRALGYLDGEEELTVASGILFRSISTMPYGRIQSVRIDEGPVDRHFGLAKLTLSTAADGSTVALPGLPKDEAERLRALLTERGIETMAAL